MNLTIPSLDGGDMPVYLAAPPSGKGPGVVVLQEIFGVNGYIRSVCDWFAARGYLAAAPDLFWRVKPGSEFDETQVEAARAMRQRVNDDEASDDAAATLEFLRTHPASTGRAGVVGYCWGGLLSYLTGTRHRADCAVSYYGVSVEKRLETAPNLSCPLLLHFGQLDKFSPPEAIAKVQAAFANDPRVSIHVYEGANHAFAREGGASYHRDAAELANSRTIALFEEQLKPR